MRTTGFGVVDVGAGGASGAATRLSYVASGCVRSRSEQTLPERIASLFAGVREALDTFQPQEAAIEKVFVNINPQSSLLLGQARGAALSALTLDGMLVREYTALQIKQAVVGNGKAAKEQVQHMVMRLLNLSAPPQSDAADALACAICHAHSSQGLGHVTGALSMRGGRLARRRTA